MLVVTGLKLLSPATVVATFRASTQDGILWGITFTAILATDLLRGLVIALGAALLSYAFDALRSKRPSFPASTNEGALARVSVTIQK